MFLQFALTLYFDTVSELSYACRRYFQHAHFIPIVDVGKR